VPKSYLNLYGSSVDAAQEDFEDGEDFGGISAEKITQRQEESAMKVAAGQVEEEFEGKKESSNLPWRSEHLAISKQHEVQVPDLSLDHKPETQSVAGEHTMDKGVLPETQSVAGEHTMDKGILPETQSVAGEHTMDEGILPKTKLDQKYGAVWPKFTKPSKQTSDVNPQLCKSLQRSVHIASKSFCSNDEMHANDMPIGTAMGHRNPCDNALDADRHGWIRRESR
jgi:hypothetical protein